MDFDVLEDQSNGHALKIPHARQETTSFTVTEYAARDVGAMDGDWRGPRQVTMHSLDPSNDFEMISKKINTPIQFDSFNTYSPTTQFCCSVPSTFRVDDSSTIAVDVIDSV